MDNTRSATTTVKVWDPVVRIGHWLLVAGFFTAYFTEDDFLAQHVWAGYVVAAVIVVRVAWGFVGTRHARFSDFMYGPAAALAYLRALPRRTTRRYLGHNPAGALMVVALLAMISATAWSGLVIYAIEEGAGPLSGWVAAEGEGASREADERREDFWEEVHEITANLSLLLVVIHVSGVFASSLAHRENLVKAMITGRKRRDDDPATGDDTATGGDPATGRTGS